MTETFTLTPVVGTVVVRAVGAIIAESPNALELRKEGCDPVLYIPREDIGMAFLDRSETLTTDPNLGEAAYFHIAAKSGVIKDTAWSYEAPPKSAEAFRDHLAFYSDKVAVEIL